MAGGRVKGITIEIGGDTTGLDKSLKNVDKSLSSTQSALRDVNRLLKLDPKNTELLVQKQRLLQDAIEETEDRLKVLQKADEQAKKQLARGDLGQDKYDALQREIIETENKLENLKVEAATSSKSIGNSFASMGNKAKAAGDALQPLSKAAAGVAAAAIATVPATEELRTDLARLDQNARESGAGIDVARNAFEKFNVISDEVDSSVEATSNLLQAGFTESNLQKAVEGLSGAYLRFPDTLKVESLADSLQETLASNEATGQFGELLDRLGIGAEKFNKGLAEMTTEAEKQNYVLETLASAGLTDTYNEYLKNNEALVESKQANYEFQEAMAGFAEVLVPIVTKMTEFATRLINWFNQLSPIGQKITAIFVAVMSVLSPVITVIGKVASGVSKIVKAVKGMSWIPKVITKIGAVFKALFALIMAHPVVAIIAAIVAAIVLLYKKCDWFKEAINNMVKKICDYFKKFKEYLIEVFNNVKNKIGETIGRVSETVKNGFSKAIDFLKSLKTKAITWGKDFMQGMIDGIKSKINSIVSAVKGVAEKIASFLHFSRPDMGPLRYYEEWMPDFIDGMTKGIYANLPKVEKAAEMIASSLNMGEIKSSGNNGLDVNAIYGAIKAGARDAEKPLIIDGRRLDRALKERGVVYCGN